MVSPVAGPRTSGVLVACARLPVPSRSCRRAGERARIRTRATATYARPARGGYPFFIHRWARIRNARSPSIGLVQSHLPRVAHRAPTADFAPSHPRALCRSGGAVEHSGLTRRAISEPSTSELQARSVSSNPESTHRECRRAEPQPSGARHDIGDSATNRAARPATAAWVQRSPRCVNIRRGEYPPRPWRSQRSQWLQDQGLGGLSLPKSRGARCAESCLRSATEAA